MYLWKGKKWNGLKWKDHKAFIQDSGNASVVEFITYLLVYFLNS